MDGTLKSVEAELLAVTQQRETLAAQMEALQRRGAAADAAKEQQHAKQLEALAAQIRKLKQQQSTQQAQLRARQAIERRVGELQAGRTCPCTPLHPLAPPCAPLHLRAPSCTLLRPLAPPLHRLSPPHAHLRVVVRRFT